MTQTNNPFKADKLDFRRLAKRTVDIAAEHLESLGVRHVDRVVPENERRQLLDQPLPKRGLSADNIIDFLRDHVMPWPLPTGHERSYGWINSPPAPIGILANTLATSLNATLDGYDHAGIFLLGCVSRWMMELLEIPAEGSMGLLLSGGSACNLNALTVARHHAAKHAGYDIRRDGLQSIDRKLLIYCSAEAHSSIQKCAETLGLGSSALRLVPTDDNFRARADLLEEMIDDDVKAGHLPCCVVALAGATNTGAIDPLDCIADICSKRGIWLHIDAAYGAIGILDPIYHNQFTALSRANTVTFNPHKWLMTPVDCGALFVRDKGLQREAFSLVPDYLEEGGSEDAPWPYQYSFQLTYADRAVKTWATLARLGRDGLSELVVRLNHLARALAVRLESRPGFELLAPVSLSIVCFRYVPKPDLDESARDELQAAISTRISESGEAHMPTTRVNGRRCLRVCFMHYDNDECDIDHLIELVERVGATA
jgi:aromatic-L-amino-acid decarboxylase